MSLAIVLLLMRVLSAIALLALMATLLIIMWQDYRSAVSEVEASRRVYGYLVRLKQVETDFITSGEVHPLLPVTTLGRAPTNTVRLDDQFASSEHATVILRSGVWWLEDHGSRNGTRLNSLDVDQPVIVTHDDIINIGTLFFRLELEA